MPLVSSVLKTWNSWSKLQYLNVAKAVLRLSVPLVSSVQKTWNSWSSPELYINVAKAALRLSVPLVS